MEWFEDEKFWRDVYPFLFPKDRLEKTPWEVERVFALLDRPVRSVLDLCCGPGRFSITMANLGLQVTGVDKSAYYLDKAREKASREGAEVEWVKSDMRDFVRENAFDLVLSMFTSFGYFEDENDDLKVLRNIHESLNGGGALVMDLAGKEWIAENFQETALDKMPDGSILIQHREIIEDWSRIRNEWILVSGGKAKTFEFSHTIYSGKELGDLLRRAGFHDVRLFGDLEGNSYGVGSKRLIAVAGK